MEKANFAPDRDHGKGLPRMTTRTFSGRPTAFKAANQRSVSGNRPSVTAASRLDANPPEQHPYKAHPGRASKRAADPSVAKLNDMCETFGARAHPDCTRPFPWYFCRLPMKMDAVKDKLISTEGKQLTATMPRRSRSSWTGCESSRELQRPVPTAHRRAKPSSSASSRSGSSQTGKKVLILTYRIELLGQTSRMLSDIGVDNKIIDSKVKVLRRTKNTGASSPWWKP